LVDLKDTIRSFKAIMNGEGDDLPEGAFYMGMSPSSLLFSFSKINITLTVFFV
jgi:F0F1-type ATP synthase beta subunit